MIIKSQSIAYLHNGSERVYWILDLEGEVHSIRGLWISGLQECKGNGFFEVGQAGNNFWSGSKNLDFMDKRLPLPESTSPKKFVGGGLTSPAKDWYGRLLNGYFSLLTTSPIKPRD